MESLSELRKRFSAGFKEFATWLSSACEKEFECELIFGFFLLVLMLLVGGFEVSIVLGDFGDEGVSNNGLLFFSFVVIGGKI